LAPPGHGGAAPAFVGAPTALDSQGPLPHARSIPSQFLARRPPSSRLLAAPQMGFGRSGWLSKETQPLDGMPVAPADRPKRIILVRHGESKGNRDSKLYAEIPDSKIELTDAGVQQAVIAGMQIRKLIANESVQFFVSPYMRTRQTMASMLNVFTNQTFYVSSETKLREQDFGNFQSPMAMNKYLSQRQLFGRFFYRFPNGEAGTDVYDRMSAFITYMFRTMEHPIHGKADNYVLVTHGLLMRFFCMCYFRWTVEEFEQIWNPVNAEVWVLEKHPVHGTYEFMGRWVANSQTGKYIAVKFGANQSMPLYEYMKRRVSREVAPGTPNALDAPELRFLKDVPGPTGKLSDVAEQEIMKYWDSNLPLNGEGFGHIDE